MTSRFIYLLNAFCLFSRLGDNPFRCDCNLVWMAPWLRKHSRIVDDVKCMKPDFLYGKRTEDLMQRDFKCNQNGSFVLSFPLPPLTILLLYIQAIHFTMLSFKTMAPATWAHAEQCHSVHLPVRARTVSSIVVIGISPKYPTLYRKMPSNCKCIRFTPPTAHGHHI